MAKKRVRKKPEGDLPSARSAIAVVLQRRWGLGVRVMKHRLQPQGGAKRPDHYEGWLAQRLESATGVSPNMAGITLRQAKGVLRELTARGSSYTATLQHDGTTVWTETPASASIAEILGEKGWRAWDAEEYLPICRRVVEAHPKEADTFVSKGKVPLLGFFVGKVMAETRDGVDPEVAEIALAFWLGAGKDHGVPDEIAAEWLLSMLLALLWGKLRYAPPPGPPSRSRGRSHSPRENRRGRLRFRPPTLRPVGWGERGGGTSRSL